ncbi:lysine transporter LysE [Mangrovactinospora gilvigrisea]|uniref:Lysine transporter LysE n=1 Tax=Mangrovactinospora gilvigrisea TaxID=1428644 RepID=A0A1J7BA25_9ACTN|nr:LysE family translocator [Mangrovactinospora gilvigrisea]OIV35543.1 lysine transporter LysE [Mangrovactinospora gilvigrisea]
MVSADRIAVFAGVSFLIIVVPGPSVLFTVGRALAHGRRTALATVLGNALGEYALVALVGLGLGALVQRSDAVFTGVKLAGAAYLVYLGVRALLKRGSLRAALQESGERRSAAREVGRARSLADGFLVGLANPKSVVFFAAVLPQFVDRGAGHVPLQMMLLGVVFCLIAVLSDSVWALLASGARSWFARSPRRLDAIGGAGGLMMIGLGVTVAATGRKD